jgi:CheY-like chemotaxis protein
MKKSGQKAASIVQDLLTLARRGAVAKKPVNLNKIIKDYLGSPEFEKLNNFHPQIKINSNLESDLFNIQGSEIHLTKTIMNLVSNAAESMPSGGVIELTTSNQHLEQTVKGYDKLIPPGNYVTFKISDQGVGIPRNRLKKIFEPFYTHKTLGRSGTGLGMAVVWGTVIDHNGYIVINSSTKKGTIFELFFPPSIEKQIRKKSNLKLSDYKGNRERILVVDDIEEQREIASSILTKLGYRVNTVASGEEALEYLKTNHPDMVILDMIMHPGIDGLDTYINILKLKPGLKTIITSGYSETTRVKKALKMGVGSYIRKPYTMETLGLAVRNLLKQ